MLMELLADRDPGPEALLCQITKGTPLVHSSFRTHFWKKAKARAGVECPLPRPPPHERRASHRRRAHPKVMQVCMGRSSITVTLDRYGRLFPELDEAIATAFDPSCAQARAPPAWRNGRAAGTTSTGLTGRVVVQFGRTRTCALNTDRRIRAGRRPLSRCRSVRPQAGVL